MRCDDDGVAECAAQWSDDVHHSIRTLLTGERFGFYSCVTPHIASLIIRRYGTVACLAETLRRGVYGEPGRVSKRDENDETDKLPMRGDAIVVRSRTLGCADCRRASSATTIKLAIDHAAIGCPR